MKKIEVNEQRDAIQVKIKEDGKVITVRYLSKEMYKLLSEKSKQEVFDDVEDMLYKIPAEAVNKFQLTFPFDFKDIKKRHLSTSKEAT